MENTTYSLMIRDGEIVDGTSRNQIYICFLTAEEAQSMAFSFLSQGYIVNVEMEREDEESVKQGD